MGLAGDFDQRQKPVCAPVLLLGFNRPDFMAEQIAAVSRARPSRLYIAVDGPRERVTGEAVKCQQVRDCVNLIDWPCEVKTLFREKNFGCKYGVSGAISWFFENEESGIVLEDDCRPTLSFFRFATEMLELYKDDDRVGAINGFNFFNLQSDKNASYHFSSHMDVWGWASWRRVWKEYDVELAKFKGQIKGIIERSKVNVYTKRVYSGFISDLEAGLSTWDVQLSILFMAKDWLSVVPKIRLVVNAGFADTRATHTGGYVYWQKDWSRAGYVDGQLVHPKEVVCDEAADRLRERMEGAIFPRGLTWIGAKVPRLSGLMTVVGKIAEKIAPFLFR